MWTKFLCWIGYHDWIEDIDEDQAWMYDFEYHIPYKCKHCGAKD